MSSFWHWYITILSVGYIFAVLWLLLVTRRTKSSMDEQGTDQLMEHSYDGIQEYNNPMPRWWIQLFYITIIFAFLYLALYPGLGNFKGYLNWTSAGQHAEEVAVAEKTYGPIFKKYAAISIEELTDSHPEALEMGQRIFLNNCAVCHGSDAGGAPGFPALNDNDWLHGGTPAQIEKIISEGKSSSMPAWEAILGKSGVEEVASYVFKLSNRPQVNEELAAAGKARYDTMCVACHGADGKGVQMLGGPNLTDNIWLYGGSAGTIAKTIAQGRNGEMPAHKGRISSDRIHLVAAYVYSLSNEKK